MMVLKRQKTDLRDSLSYLVQREYLLKDVIKMTQTSERREMSKMFLRGRIQCSSSSFLGCSGYSDVGASEEMSG